MLAGERGDVHNRQNLEEVVLGEVLVGVVGVKLVTIVSQLNRKPRFKCEETYRPEVVNQNVENTQQNDQDNSTPLSLEANNDHHASDKTKQTNNYTPEAPRASEDESDEEKDEQDAPGELHIHLTVLLVKLGQTGRNELLANPGVGDNHEQTADDTQVAEEEVQVENEAISETLSDDHS